MFERIKRQLSLYYGNGDGRGHKLHIGLGTPEIIIIVAAIVLIFGVGKLGNVGGALGKSIREFRKEKDKDDHTPKLTTKDNNEADNDKSETQS